MWKKHKKFNKSNKNKLFKIILLSIIFIIIVNDLHSSEILDYKLNNDKPFTRYWWFASMIQKDDIRFNLDYLKKNGFGGVEIAWVYPLNRFNKNDTTYTPRQEWQSAEWTEIVDFAKNYADSIGLMCDFTFGTLWPFGDNFVKFDEATQRFGDKNWRQEIRLSWQHPKVGYVIDHLTPKNYFPYFNRMIKALPKPNKLFNNACFIDSWEVETEKLWCDGFDSDFNKRFGYDVVPFMDSIYSPKNKNQLYDYMTLISDKVLKFYSDYDSVLNKNGFLSRGQVSGAPCDLISGYSKLDIPEGESMLFEPEFCAIPASAALLSKAKYISSETFTCLYGWPRDYIREEQTADLKLVADALFANGINHIIWHGKAHNPKNSDSVNFYATTHIGKDGTLYPELANFNNYLEKVSSFMKKGNTYSDVAVYLPTEDAWIKGVMPKNLQFKWAWGFYEMRYVYFPDELKAYNPTWINGEFLKKAKCSNGRLIVGNANYSMLYVDAEYLDFEVLKRLNELANQGLKIVLKQNPKNPSAVKISDYSKTLENLKNSKNVLKEIPKYIEPFISGKQIPEHWCRIDNKTIYIFFPNPKAKRLKFPMEYGQSLCNETYKYSIEIKLNIKKKYAIDLEFKPYQSLLYKIEDGKIEQIDISFMPKIPTVKKRPDNYEAPWLVK